MLSGWTRHLVIAVFTAIVLAAVAVLGQVPFGRQSGKAVLRLSLRTVQARTEICRDLSAAELEALPQHMRQPRMCSEVAPPYRLRVAIDMRPVIDELIEPGGLRGDRPLIVDRQVSHRAGKVRLQVKFEPLLEATPGEPVTDAADQLPSYALDRRIDLAAHRVTLVLLDDATGRLEIYGDP